MVYVKSLIAGLAAITMAVVLAIFGLGIYMYIVSKSTEEGAIGWDPVALNRPLPWIVAALIFTAGFVWEFRRAAK
jgi:hypothetical protein